MAWSISDYRAQYAAADILSQEVQGFRNEAGIPAMNELRNAGHHFLKALDDNGGVANQSELDSAVNHARRACYEATEAGIVLVVAIVQKFQEDYATIEIGNLVPNYAERCRKSDEALKLVEAGRADDFNRDGDHTDRISVFREIRPFAQDLTYARPEANKKVTADRRLARRFAIQISIAILAILVTVSGIIWASTKYTHFWESAPPAAPTNVG